MLRDDPDQLARFVCCQITYFHAADLDASRIVVPVAQQQVGQRRFARPAGTDDAQSAARRHFEANAIQRRHCISGVAEVKIFDHQPEAGGSRGRLRRIDHRWRRVDQFEETARGGLAGLQHLECLRQRLDSLKAGDGRQRQQRQVDAVDLPAGDQWNRQCQHRQRCEAGEQRRQPVAHAANDCQPLLQLVELVVEAHCPLVKHSFLAIGKHVGHSLDLVHQSRVQFGARQNRLAGRLLAQPAADQWQRDTRQQQKDQQRHGQDDIEISKDRAGQPGHQYRDQRRHDDADVEVFQRLDVGADTSQQVAAADGLQAGRRQRLYGAVEPDPQPRQDAEGRQVRDIALSVAEPGSTQCEEAHARDGHGELGDIGCNGCFGDQICGHCHQPDAGANGGKAKEDSGNDPPDERADE